MCPTIVPLMRETKKEQDIYFTSLIETMKILVATEKPFAKKAVDGIRKIVEDAGYELALLEKYTDKGQLLEAVADVDALIVRSDKVTAEVIAAAKNLKIVVRAGAGYDNVDLAAASARGIVVMNTPGQNSNAVAELALAMMIFMSRNRFTPGTGTELQGKTLGIHAYGNVGRLVGRKGKALGMNVVAYDPFIADGAVFEADGVKKVASVEELYRVSDFLSLHIPATAQTKGSIGYDRTRGPEIHHRHRRRQSGRAGREVRQTGFRHGEEDGRRDRRGQCQRGTRRRQPDRRFSEERQHPFPGQQIETNRAKRRVRISHMTDPLFRLKTTDALWLE